VTPRLALLVLISLALPLSTASAQGGTQTPSAKELWQSYPLDPSPAPADKPRATASPARSAPTPAPATRQSGTPVVPLLLLGVVIALGALAVPELRRRRAERPRPAPAPPRGVLPPNPQRAWTASIEWRQADGEARFCVLARGSGDEPGSVLAESEPVPWPPTDPAAVQALAEAAQRLEAALLSAGWRPLPPGREWYAKRLSWEPAAARQAARPRRGRAPAHAR
jgi:hypothetical protein